MKTSNYIIWLIRANSNLDIAKQKFTSKRVVLEDLCNNCHQAVEKALKVFWFFDEIPPLTHNILVLAQNLSIHIIVSEVINIIGLILIPYAFKIKYPGVHAVSIEQYEQACDAAEEYVTWVIPEIEKITQKQIDFDQ